ncbi:MAG: BrxA/BrxB family bacilliredoxin [Candidatus Sumerlaeia bacterium]|nr:BrxA/BrxB family bacilliredoxin [Candidatus Sumerlaeia bacterium]
MALPPLYDPEACRPMWEELNRVGVKSLRTPEEVDADVKSPGTALVVVNSVCGCAAGSARPGVMLALQHSRIPDRCTTVFAGVDREAVDQARRLMPEVPPSSPCIALFKDGKPVHVLQRAHIEQMNPAMIADSLSRAFDAHCTAAGPSIPPEEFAKVVPVQQCGSNVPRL